MHQFLTYHCFNVSLFWHKIILTYHCLDILSFWPIIVSTYYCFDISLYWNIIVLKYYCCVGITSSFLRVPHQQHTWQLCQRLPRCPLWFPSWVSSSERECRPQRESRYSIWPARTRSCPAGRSLPSTCGWGRWRRRWRWSRRWWPSQDWHEGFDEEEGGPGCGSTDRRTNRKWRRGTKSKKRRKKCVLNI